MQKKLLYGLILFLLLPVAACNATDDPNAPFKEGKDYEVIAPNADIPAPPIGKIEVAEFFSYGCPACNHLEPDLEKWLANSKPKDVVFTRYHMTFEPGWNILARAFYTAKILGVENKITPDMFNAIHVQGMDMTDEKVVTQFFVDHGVKKQDFTATYNFLPRIDGLVIRGTNLMQAYGIVVVPTIVIDGKYRTNPLLVDGNNQRLLQIVDYLIAKERQ